MHSAISKKVRRVASGISVFENWNRYYDPFTGRYIQPEPMYVDVHRPGDDNALINAIPMKYRAKFLEPEWMPFAKAGMGAPPAYSYVFNNPIKNTDPNGRGCTDTYSCCIEHHPNDPEACGGEERSEAERIRCKGVGAIARELCLDKLGGDNCGQGFAFTNCVNEYKVARGCPPGSL